MATRLFSTYRHSGAGRNPGRRAKGPGSSRFLSACSSLTQYRPLMKLPRCGNDLYKITGFLAGSFLTPLYKKITSIFTPNFARGWPMPGNGQNSALRQQKRRAAITPAPRFITCWMRCGHCGNSGKHDESIFPAGPAPAGLSAQAGRRQVKADSITGSCGV